jgi:hypothetical protein
MDCLVHAAHLSFANPIEDLVLTEKEVVGTASLDESRLILREGALCHEELAERFDLIIRSTRLRAPLDVETLDLFDREKLALGK